MDVAAAVHVVEVYVDGRRTTFEAYANPAAAHARLNAQLPRTGDADGAVTTLTVTPDPTQTQATGMAALRELAFAPEGMQAAEVALVVVLLKRTDPYFAGFLTVQADDLPWLPWGDAALRWFRPLYAQLQALIKEG